MSTNQIDNPEQGARCKCGGSTWEQLDEHGHYYQCEMCGADSLPRYEVTNERYGNDMTPVTFFELSEQFRDIFPDIELRESVNGAVYTVAGELVARRVAQ